MSQASVVIANDNGANVRSAINNALMAGITLSSGPSAPTPTYAYMLWADTTNGLMKQRNSSNTTWITLGTLDATSWGHLLLAGGTMTGALLAAVGTAGAPGIAFSGDSDTGMFRQGADKIGLATAGVERARLGNLGLAVGIGADPSYPIHVSANSGTDKGYFSALSGAAYVGVEGDKPINFETDGGLRASISKSFPYSTGIGAAGSNGFTIDSNRVARSYRQGTTVNNHIVFINSNNAVGLISSNGSTTTYSTTSDARLKDQVQSLEDCVAIIAALNPVRYRWKLSLDGDEGVGFLAQDLFKVIPEAVVVGDDDAALLPGHDDVDDKFESWAVDLSKIVPYLVGAVQQLSVEIGALKNKMSD